jgi:hypothetical protein
MHSQEWLCHATEESLRSPGTTSLDDLSYKTSGKAKWLCNTTEESLRSRGVF